MNTITANFLQVGDKVRMSNVGAVRTVVKIRHEVPNHPGKVAVKFNDTREGKVEMLAYDQLLFR